MSAQGRTAQRAWLLEHFPADEVVVTATVPAFVRTSGHVVGPTSKATTNGPGLAQLWESWYFENVVVRPCCRCYRCGKLLTAAALWPDKVDPNGTTRRSNLRPACSEHVGMTPPRPMTDAQVAEATRRHRAPVAGGALPADADQARGPGVTDLVGALRASVEAAAARRAARG